MTTTGAQDVAAGLLSILSAYRVAHPTLLRGVFGTRPASFAEIPVAYVELGSEDVSHDAGTRIRRFAPTVVVVDAFSDNEQLSNRLNVLRDGLIDAFTAGIFTITNLPIGMTRVDPTVVLQEFADGRPPFQYPALVFSFGETQLMEGRV